MDNRLSVNELYQSYEVLCRDFGWEKETMYLLDTYPAYSFKTPKQGKSLYLTSGIHGEEPAGPCAIARSITTIASLGERFPVILRPLCNPLGYVKNTRYFSGEGDWKKGVSVVELEGFMKSILNNLKEYPPLVSIDFHEEANPNVTPTDFYIYSQGKLGVDDSIAKEIFKILKSTGINYLKKGKTRFGEPVINGMIGPVADGSIDQFLAKHATTSIVTETPTGIDLKKRIEANKLIIDSLESILVGVAGLEPTTSASQTRRSTN